MPGPTANFDTVQVRGRYIGIDGTKPQGEVVFELDASRLVDGAAKTNIVPIPIRVELVDGAFQANIPATDDPDIAPDGFTWHVTENFPGGGNYHIQVPIDQIASGIEIAEVVPVTAAPGEYIPQEITRIEFENLEGRVTTIEGELGGTGFVTDAELATDLALKADEADLLAHEADHNNPHAVTKAQVGLGNVDNTSDLNKPISDLTQSALNTKAPINSPTFTGTVGGLTKFMVGLGNVDNTTDLTKPVSAAQQAALDVIQAEIDALTVGSGSDTDVAGYINDTTPSATRAALNTLLAGVGGGTNTIYYPEDPLYGAVADGTTDDTAALQACIDAAAANKGGVCMFLGRYGWRGDLIIKGGVTVIGAGGPQLGSPAGSELGLQALDSSARVRWGRLNDGTGSMNDNPGPIMNLCIDGKTIGGATELFRAEAVETSLFNVHIINGAGDGINWTQSQNVNVYNPLIGGFPNGCCWLLKAGTAGLQPPGHIVAYGGHIGDSRSCWKATSWDATFFSGPHDNYFIGTIFESGRTAGVDIDHIGSAEDGDTHLVNCVNTIGAQVSAINDNACLVVRNDIRTSTTTTLVLNNCTIGGGAGAVKATYGVRNIGAATHVSNQIIYSTRTSVANVTYMHANDVADGLVTLDGPIIHITGVTEDFIGVNGGAITGLLKQSKVPIRYTGITGAANPIQLRNTGDTSNRLQITALGVLQWLDGAAGTLRGTLTRSTTTNIMAMGGTWQASGGWGRTVTTTNVGADTALTIDASLVSHQAIVFTATGVNVTSITINNPYSGAELRIGISGFGTNGITWPSTSVIVPRSTLPQPGALGVIVFIDLCYYGAKWYETGRSG